MLLNFHHPRCIEDLLQTVWHRWVPTIFGHVLVFGQMRARLFCALTQLLTHHMLMDYAVFSTPGPVQYYVGMLASTIVCFFGRCTWPLTKLHMMLGNTGKSGRGQPAPLFTFLGRPIGRVCLCNVMAMGINRFRRALEMAPDLRFGLARKGMRQAASESVNAFLHILY